jgi:hypothetical protein
VACLTGVSPITVSEWSSGKRPIPPVRHLALLLFVARWLGGLRHKESVAESSKAAARLKAAHDAVEHWLRLAEHEFPHLDEPEDGEVLVAAGELLKRGGFPWEIIWKNSRGEAVVKDVPALLDRLLAEEERGEA